MSELGSSARERVVRLRSCLKTEPEELLMEQVSGRGEKNQSRMTARNGKAKHSRNGILLGN